jgi:hypothetical protein
MSGNPMQSMQRFRCGARTRSGKPCQSPPVRGRKRCRMHGGAHGSGAPRGPRNGNYRHGRRTAEAIAVRRELMAFLREAREFTKSLVEPKRSRHDGR